MKKTIITNRYDVYVDILQNNRTRLEVEDE